jgi:hypothetical protein
LKDKAAWKSFSERAARRNATLGWGVGGVTLPPLLWSYILAVEHLLPSEYVTAIGSRGGSVMVGEVE